MFYVLLATLPFLLVLSALASGSETALFTLTAEDRARIARRSPRAGRAIDRLLAAPRMLLIQVLVLNMTVNVVYFVVSSVLTIRAPSPVLAAAVSVGSVLGIILIGEVIAKMLAGSNAAAAALRLALPLLGIRRIMYPLLVGLDRFAVGPLARLLHPAPSASGVSRAELEALLEQATGALSPPEQEMLREVVGLRDRRVRDIMMPRVDLKWVGPDWKPGMPLPPGQEFVPASDDQLHRRVCFSIDARLAAAGPGHNCKMVPVFFPENARLDQLLSELARRGAEHAYCVDEYGEIQGIVRIADVIDELVSGVSTAEAKSVMLVGMGVWRVPGRLPAHDFAELFQFPGFETASEQEGVSTVAGLVLAALGRVPSEGDSVQVGDYLLTVTRMKNRAIIEVEVRALGAAAESEDE